MELFTRKKIRLPKNLGEKLRLQRKRKDVDLNDAEAETKIAMKYLAALEHSEYDKLPADVYVYGFLERYAVYLGLDKDLIVNMYRDEKKIFDSVKNIKKHSDQKNANLIKPKPNEKWLKTSRFIVTPELAIGFFVAVVVIGMLGYIWFQVKSFAAAPPLEIKNAEAEIVVSANSIVVSGLTDAQASLNINNQTVGIGTDGNFSQEVQLSKGINTIEIVAKNKANKETKKTIQILSK
jgi:cytoskeletal protein RodZ